jgi:hypothetical protein
MHFEEMCRDCPLLFYLLDKRSLLDLRLSPPQDEGAGPAQQPIGRKNMQDTELGAEMYEVLARADKRNAAPL